MEMFKVVYEFFSGGMDQHIGVAVKVIGSALAVAMVIPGEQPDKFLKGLLDKISAWSKKPKDPEAK